MSRTIQDDIAHDASLARYWTSLAQVPGGRVFAQGRERGAITGMRRALLNPAIISEGRPDDIAALHRQMEDAANDADVSCIWWLGARAQGATVRSELEALGLIAAGGMPAMEYELGTFSALPLPDGCAIRSITTAKDRAAAGHALCLAFGFDDKLALAFAANEAAMSPEGLAGTERYVLMHEDRPVSYATLVMSEGMAGIYAVATPQTERGKGYGRAVTEHCMVRAQQLGARRIGLQASGMGEPVYRRIGFATVSEYLWYAPEDD